MAKFISLYDTRDVYRRVLDASFIEISDITHQFHTWDDRVAIGRIKTQSATLSSKTSSNNSIYGTCCVSSKPFRVMLLVSDKCDKRVQFQITYKYLVNTREILFHPLGHVMRDG